MHFDASSGRPIDEGVGMINDMLYWDKENSEDKARPIRFNRMQKFNLLPARMDRRG